MSRVLIRQPARSEAAPAGSEPGSLRSAHNRFLPDTLAKVISPHGSMVRGLMSLTPDPGDPQLFLSLAVPSNPRMFGSKQHGLIDFFASGVGFTLQEANTSAVAEAVERYCAAYVIPEKTLLATWEQLGEAALHPRDLPLFSEEQHRQWQFPYRPFNERSSIRWVQAENLTTGCSKWVPAAIAWDSYQPQSADEESICFGLMTGSAAGVTKEQAMIGGLLEIIERDAFMIMWYNSLSMPRLDIRNHPVSAPFRALLDESRFELTIVDTTGDLGIPSTFGLLRTKDGKISIGGSARLNLEDSVRKTLMEISQLFIGNKAQIYAKSLPSLLPHQIVDYGSRLPYYEQPFAYEELAFTAASPEVRVLEERKAVQESEAQRLEFLVKQLADRGLEALCVDITTEDAREQGLHVVKMIVPGTVQLPRSENERLITSRRIYETPVQLGLRQEVILPQDLNRSPHPFP